MTIRLPRSAVVIGPNTLSGTPQFNEAHPEWATNSEFVTPRSDNLGAEFDSNASRVALWFRTWAEAQEFVAQLEYRNPSE